MQNKKHFYLKLKTIFYSFLVFFFVFTEKALASVDRPTGSLKLSKNYDTSLTRFSDANTFLTSLVDFFLNFVAIVAIIAIIYGGFLMLTSGGDEGAWEKGKTIIIYVVAGIILIIGSYAIVNTVINFGNKNNPEGIGPGVVGSSGTSGDENSDDSRIIKAFVAAQPTVGTLPLVVNFNTEGSYDLSEKGRNNFYWNFKDNTAIAGVMSYSNNKTTFKIAGQTEMPIVINSGLVANSISACGDEKFCFDLSNPNSHIRKQIEYAQAKYVDKKNPVIEEMNAQKTYPVLIYGRKRRYNEEETSTLLVESQKTPTEYDEVIDVLDPGDDGYAVTILNPYGLELGNMQQHKYTTYGNNNYAPIVYLVNDNDTPLSPNDDIKSYKSTLIKISKDNLDPLSIPPTSAFIYTFDPDDPKKVSFRNVSLDEKGAPILSDSEAVVPNGKEIPDQPFYFEWDFDLSKDTNGDENFANDNEFIRSNIKSFVLNSFTSGRASFSFDILETDNTNLTLEMRKAGDSTYKTLTANVIPNNLSVVSEFNPPLNKDQILFFRIKASDGTFSKEIKVKYYTSKPAEIIPQKDTVYHIFDSKISKVKIKLLTKNLITQSYDNSVREITIPDKAFIDKVPPTALFAYKVIPGTSKVVFYNDSFHADGKALNQFQTVAVSGDTENTVIRTATKDYSFAWDFDTKQEIDKLLIQQERNLQNTIQTNGTVIASNILNQYSKDSVTDNDINTVYNGLGTATSIFNNGIVVNFPDKNMTYDVKLTVYDITDTGDPNTTEIMDSRTISVTVPPEPDKPRPIAAFSYRPEIGSPGSSAVKIYLKNLSKAYSLSKNKHYYITTGFSLGSPEFEDLNKSNFDFFWDLDLKKDSDNDGNPENDNDIESGYYGECTSTVKDPKDVLSSEMPEFEATEYFPEIGKRYEVKLTVQSKISKKKNEFKTIVYRPTIEELQNSIQSPVAAYTFSPTPTAPIGSTYSSEATKYVKLENKSRGINGAVITSAQLNNYVFTWDINTEVDSNGDGTMDNDNDNNKLVNDSANPLIKYVYYDQYGDYKVKLNVKYINSQGLVKTDDVIRTVSTRPSGTPLPPTKPIASFRFQESGDKQIQFFSTSLNSSGLDIPSGAIQVSGVKTPNPILQPINGANGSSYTLKWDFDLDTDADGNGDKEDDNNFSTFIDNTNKYIQGNKNLLNPLRYYGIYETPLNETKNTYGSYRVKLTITEFKTGSAPLTDSVIRTIKLNNPPLVITPLVNFTYAYTAATSGAITVSFTDSSTDLFGTTLDYTKYSAYFDFDLNKDSDRDGKSDNDKDNLTEGALPNKPCSYQGSAQPSNKIYVCTFPASGEYPVKLTIRNNQNGIETEQVNVIYLDKKPDPPAPIYPDNIPAFIYEKNPAKDNEIIFTNKAINSRGVPILSNISYDFDLSFDSDGDGTPNNDKDSVGQDNENFKVLSGKPEGSIAVEYKAYRTYDVKQSVQDVRPTSVTRKVKVGPNTIPTPPVPLFTYSKNGTLVRFKNASIDGLGFSLRDNPTYNFAWYMNYQGESSVSPDFNGFGPEFEFDYKNLEDYQNEQFGSFNARLELTNEDGEKYFIDRTITISNDSSNQEIRANIIATPKNGSAPLTVNFSSEGSKDNNGSIDTIYWDFDGDGQPDNTGNNNNQTNINYTYTKPGHYRVGLAVQGPSGRAIAFTWVDVYGDPPKATILINDEFAKEDKKDPYLGFIDLPMNFQAIVEDKMGTPTTSYTWGWDFNDPLGDTIADGNNATHTFSSPGNYEIAFIVTNNETRLTNTIRRKLIINRAPPIARIIAKELGKPENQSGSAEKFFTGVSSLSTGRFDIEFLASESTGAPLTSECTSSNCSTELVKFIWDFGDGTDTSAVNKDVPVKHSYSRPGTYLATLTITDSTGVEAKATKTVFVADARKPIPSIQITPLQAVTGSTITFDATKSRSANGPITEFTWQIGNAPFTATNPGIKLLNKVARYSFNSPGKLDVSLVLKDRLGETTSVLLEDILEISSQKPIAKIDYKQKDPSIPNEFTFDASLSLDQDEGDKLSYIWNFGDSTTVETTTTPTVDHIYDNIGRFTAKVIVRDSSMKSDEASIVVRVDSLLRAKIETVTPRAGKAPLTVNFAGVGGYNKRAGIDSSVVANYEWDFGDGTVINGSQMKTATHKYFKGGKFQVVLTVYDNDDRLSKTTKYVYVGTPDPAPIAIIEEGPVEGFRKVPINFNGFNSLTPEEIPDSEDNDLDLEYSWNFGDDTPVVSGDAEPVHTYNKLGNFTVTLTVRDSLGRSSKDQMKIEIVKSRPSARFKATPAYGKAPLLVKFDASNSSDPDDNIENYVWKFDSQTSIATTNKIIEQPLQNKSSRPITYNVNLKVIDKDGLSDTYILPITVTPEN